MAQRRFASLLARLGEAVVVRHRGGEAREYGGEGGFGWTDVMETAVVQPRAALSRGAIAELLRGGGVLPVGEAAAYLPPWASVEVGDRIIFLDEYEVASLDPWTARGETVYVAAALKRASDTVQAAFADPNRAFYDDFDGSREEWMVKSGSWSVTLGRYRGEAPDAYTTALTVAGESWRDCVAQAEIEVESGSAGLSVRYTSPGGVDQLLTAMLRPDENLVSLEGVLGDAWARLGEYETYLEADRKYVVRVHSFGGFIMVFLDGGYLFTVSDAAFKQGQIGLMALGGRAWFDDVEAWSA